MFPGGKVDQRQDGRLVGRVQDNLKDCAEYRRCAIRELFEETGILLAKLKDSEQKELIEIEEEVREEGRKILRLDRMRFQEWIHNRVHENGALDLGESS